MNNLKLLILFAGGFTSAEVTAETVFSDVGIHADDMAILVEENTMIEQRVLEDEAIMACKTFGELAQLMTDVGYEVPDGEYEANVQADKMGDEDIIYAYREAQRLKAA